MLIRNALKIRVDPAQVGDSTQELFPIQASPATATIHRISLFLTTEP